MCHNFFYHFPWNRDFFTRILFNITLYRYVFFTLWSPFFPFRFLFTRLLCDKFKFQISVFCTGVQNVLCDFHFNIHGLSSNFILQNIVTSLQSCLVFIPVDFVFSRFLCDLFMSHSSLRHSLWRYWTIIKTGSMTIFHKLASIFFHSLVFVFLFLLAFRFLFITLLLLKFKFHIFWNRFRERCCYINCIYQPIYTF